MEEAKECRDFTEKLQLHKFRNTSFLQFKTKNIDE
jgi:hypothetical protein